MRIARAAHHPLPPTHAVEARPEASHHSAHEHSSCTACDQAHAGAKASGKHSKPVDHIELKMYMGKRDGKMHALTTNADFTVVAGKPVTVRLVNADDDMTHSFTSPDLDIDVKLPPAKDGKPTVKTITFTPTKAGAIKWFCKVPCDPEAMDTDGMMRGTITVQKPA